MTDNASRQPRGIPIGGQFAATAHAEPEVALGLSEKDVHFDPDGTEWDWNDPDATVLGITEIVNSVGALIDTSKAGEGVFTYDVVDYRASKKFGSGTTATLAEAKEAAKGARDKAAKYVDGFHFPGFSRTPWGPADYHDHIAPGIVNVSTAGHGGVKLSPARNKEVDPVWRNRNGWYEEDTEWSIAAITHPAAYSEEHRTYAHECARRWYPDEYEKVVGKDPARYGVTDYKPIAPGESSVRDEKVFFAENHDKVQRIWSASYSRDHEGMTEVLVSDVTVTGARTGEPRTVLVPSNEYESIRKFYTIPKNADYQVKPGTDRTQP